MIYLIDDKKLRQENDYNWSRNRFQKYFSFIRPIYTLRELKDNNKEIFQEGNVILYHESFIDKTDIKYEAAERRQYLEEFIRKRNSCLVLFSGSKNTRDLHKNVANIPASVLYGNLESFIIKYSLGDVNLGYLLFGDNPEIEEKLSNKLDSELIKTTKEQAYINTNKNLFIRPDEKNINQPLSNYVEKIFFDNMTDEDFSEAIVQWMNEDVYENIFIPLCFGNTLSDYNGLRLACHIRCTKTKNQTSRIFIYGFVGSDYLLHNNYFNILKTKNTFLIPFSKQAIGESTQKPLDKLLIEELTIEIAKLKLDVPQNYEDNHSIANEWAIYRWSKIIDAEDDDIRKITERVSTDLYFKYLQTIFPISDIQKIEKELLRIKKSGNPKLLYIDDEADKGWYEIFCNIINDINQIEFNYIGNELLLKTREEIIQLSLDKIENENSDVVILDFRLHQDDFSEKDINNVTGIQLLKRIKKLNPGIQVIIFSATNKVWNLQAFQKERADGFIIKESPENSLDVNFTSRSISEFVTTLNQTLDRVFLKSLFKNLETITNNLSLIDEVPENMRFNKFIKGLKKQFDVIYTSAEHIQLRRPITLDVVFLSCYTFLDLFKKYYLKKGDDHRYYLGFRQEELIRYNVKGEEVKGAGPFVPLEYYETPGVFHVYSGMLKDYFQVHENYDSDNYIIKLHKIRDYRNDYIHGTKQNISKAEVMLIIESLLPITHNIIE